MIILEIPCATPSLNELHHRHWLVAFSLKKRWKKYVRDALYLAQALPLPDTPPSYASVKIERYGKKMLDHDNLLGGVKGCVDILKDFRLIADDSPDHIHLEVLGFVTKGPVHTRIAISARMP